MSYCVIELMFGHPAAVKYQMLTLLLKAQWVVIMHHETQIWVKYLVNLHYGYIIQNTNLITEGTADVRGLVLDVMARLSRVPVKCLNNEYA